MPPVLTVKNPQFLQVNELGVVELKFFSASHLTYALYANAWTPLHLDGGLKQIFTNFMPVDLAKYGVTIICRYSKDMYFHKIWRV